MCSFYWLTRRNSDVAYFFEVALAGIRDLLIKHPSELKLHMVTVIEKLRERICDNDKAIREMLYNVLKSVIFPRIKEVHLNLDTIIITMSVMVMK